MAMPLPFFRRHQNLHRGFAKNTIINADHHSRAMDRP